MGAPTLASRKHAIARCGKLRPRKRTRIAAIPNVISAQSP